MQQSHRTKRITNLIQPEHTTPSPFNPQETIPNPVLKNKVDIRSRPFFTLKVLTAINVAKRWFSFNRRARYATIVTYELYTGDGSPT